MIWKTTRIVIDDGSPIKRMPPRLPEDRQPNYLEKFDFTTVFSDVFVRDGKVWMIGPPFLNLEPELRAAAFYWNGKDVSDKVSFEELNRMARASFPTDFRSGELRIESSIGNWTVQVPSAPQGMLKDNRVLVTQQQDNRLEWIAYWAHFNVVVNGINSIVIYDNLSTLYPFERIDQLLGEIPGLEHWVIVDWDNPYGPTGGGKNGWDSDFGQHIAWEHSRRAFASEAKSALMIDIDELPVSTQPENLLEILEKSEQKVLRFNRQPIRQFPNRSNPSKDLRTHSHFSLGESRGAWLSTKYAYVPSRLAETDQLMAHLVLGVKESVIDSSLVFAGHFDSIRIRWRRGEKEPVTNFERRDEIKEEIAEVQILDEKFEEVESSWHDLVEILKPLINSQLPPHLD